MTPTEQFVALAEAIWGEEWRSPLARALVEGGVLSGGGALQTVKRWASSESSPRDWPDILERLRRIGGQALPRLDQRAQDLRRLIKA